MIDVMDVEESDLSFASILLGFRQSIDSQDELKNLATVSVNLQLQYSILHQIHFWINHSNSFICRIITKIQRKDDVVQYLEDKIFNNSSTVPYNGPNSSLCFQVSEVQRQAGSQSPVSPTEKALQGSEKRDDIVIIEDHSSYCLDQQSSAFDQHYSDQQMQKLARGRYKCSRCGALKVRLRFFLFEILSAFYRAVSS